MEPAIQPTRMIQERLSHLTLSSFLPSFYPPFLTHLSPSSLSIPLLPSTASRPPPHLLGPQTLHNQRLRNSHPPQPKINHISSNHPPNNLPNPTLTPPRPKKPPIQPPPQGPLDPKIPQPNPNDHIHNHPESNLRCPHPRRQQRGIRRHGVQQEDLCQGYGCVEGAYQELWDANAESGVREHVREEDGEVEYCHAYGE